MGDSDEEYEKRRSRDKFRRERDNDSHERDYYQKMNPSSSGNGDRRDSKRSSSSYYRVDNSPPPPPSNSRHHSSSHHHVTGSNSMNRHHSHYSHHSHHARSGSNENLRDMMYDQRKRHNDMLTSNPNKKLKKNWVDYDNPVYDSYYQHDIREDYDAQTPPPPSHDYHKMNSQRYKGPAPYDRMPSGPPQMHHHHHHHPSMAPHRYPYNGPNNGPMPMTPFYDSPYSINYKYNKFNNENPQMMNRMNSFDGSNNNNMMFETQPQMLSFKAFLQTLNQNLTPEQATKRYNEYKNSFRREQIELFFDVHKEEEWFKFRYHPDEGTKRKDEYRGAIKRRLNIFMDLFNKGYLDNVTVDMDNHEQLKKFLCAVVIKLEDGTDDDLKILDQDEVIVVKVEQNKIENNEVIEETKKDEDVLIIDKDNKNNSNDNASDEEDADYDKDDIICVNNDKLTKSDSFNKTNKKSEENADIIMNDMNNKDDYENNDSDKESGMCSESDSDDSGSSKSRSRSSRSGSGSRSSSSSNSESDSSDKKDKKKKKIKKKKTKKSEKSSNNAGVTNNGNKTTEINKEIHSQQSVKPIIQIPKRVQSIFFKNLPVTTTRQELEDIGKKFSGFKRVAISEPAPERGFQRRAWLTYDLDVDIKDICTKLNQIKLNGLNLNATVNREIDEKIRTINPITSHKIVLRNDLKLISKVVANMDKRWSLWEYEDDEQTNENKTEKEDNNNNNEVDVKKESENGDEIKTENMDSEKNSEVKNIAEQIKTEEKPMEENETKDDIEVKNNEAKEQIQKLKNPFLINITDYLVDETSAEEEELLNGKVNDSNEQQANNPNSLIKFEKDSKLAQALDKLILYLRIVHSIDYYNVNEYQQEDWMPNRLGIIHARDKMNDKEKKIKKSELDEWIKLFETNIKSYVDYKERIDIEMAKRLGLKDAEVEVEKFLNENCKELEKDKWLCPLSGKKFKAKEYVHKHILTKHSDKLENVRKLCEYFNNFVYDPKRPYLPEHPLTKLNNSNIPNEQFQQQINPQLMPHQPQGFYPNRFMPPTSQPAPQGMYPHHQPSGLLPSPSSSVMHHYPNRHSNPNYYYQQNPYRPNMQQPPMQSSHSHHSIRFKKF